MASSAFDVSGFTGYQAPEVPNYQYGQQTAQNTALMYQQKMDDILGVSKANSAFNADQANQANQLTSEWYNQSMAYNAAEAAKNRDWQEMMSNTAHFREVQDLIRAGLNPVLSASGGNGAAVGSGATASVQTPTAQKASADTSGSSAIVSLLGHSLDSMTELAKANTSALTNIAVADKYNSMNKYLGELGALNQQEVADLYGRYGLAQAEMSGQYNLSAAGTAAAATQAAAAMSAAAQRYSSDVSERNNIRTTNVSERNNIRNNKQSNTNNTRSNETSRVNNVTTNVTGAFNNASRLAVQLAKYLAF